MRRQSRDNLSVSSCAQPVHRICALELRPRHQAGNATDANSDFRWRGGRLMISRRSSPSITAVSLEAMISRCGPTENGVRGWSSRKSAVRSSRSRVPAGRHTWPPSPPRSCFTTELPSARRAQQHGRELTQPHRHPGAGRDLSPRWAPAFAGVTRGHSGARACPRVRNPGTQASENIGLGRCSTAGPGSFPVRRFASRFPSLKFPVRPRPATAWSVAESQRFAAQAPHFSLGFGFLPGLLRENREWRQGEPGMPQGGSRPTPLSWPNNFVRVERSAIGSGGASSEAMFARRCSASPVPKRTTSTPGSCRTKR